MKLDLASIVRSATFWGMIVLGLVVQVIPYIFTLNAPAADGNTVAGFPFTFYSFGGLCGFAGGNAGQCPASFVPLHVLFNGVLITIGAMVVTRFWQLRNGLKSSV